MFVNFVAFLNTKAIAVKPSESSFEGDKPTRDLSSFIVKNVLLPREMNSDLIFRFASSRIPFWNPTGPESKRISNELVCGTVYLSDFLSYERYGLKEGLN